MKRTTKFLLAGGAVAAVAIGSGVTFAVAGGGDDSEAPITGDALTRASEAALAETGGGHVTETEVGDEESYYEVEVTLDDGTSRRSARPELQGRRRRDGRRWRGRGPRRRLITSLVG